MNTDFTRLSSPWLEHYNALVESVRDELLISAPYITRRHFQHTLQMLTEHTNTRKLRFHLITSFDPRSLLSGSLDPSVLLDAIALIPQTQITDLRGLHAKVYIADENFAVVTSANLTDGGMTGNHEYGISIRDPQQVRLIRADILKYAALGATTERRTLEILRDTTNELQKLRERSEKSIRKQFKRSLDEKIEKTQMELLRNQVHGRTKNAIFSQAIIFLLEQYPLRTVELETRIKSILPDMCDDNVDRVIEGVHFGKLWKHDVRNAQQYLKRKSAIKFDGVQWIRC